MLRENSRLPVDVRPSNGGADAVGPVAGTGLPNRPKSLEPWVKVMDEVNQTPNDIRLWDKLFTLLDSHFNKVYEQQQQQQQQEQSEVDGFSGVGHGFKKFSFDAYTQLLTRFPYLTQFWKKFLIFEYKLNGLEASINVLSKSVDCFPGSISLWVDYISALIEKQTTHISNGNDDDGVDFIRNQFQIGLKLNGYHFLAHPLWDKFFEFEESVNGSDGVDPLLYLKVIKLPLYQYSQYYQKFTEMNKKLTLEELFSEDESALGEYLAKFNMESVESFATVEVHQIIDDYSYAIFTKTQAKVNAKWSYESLIAYPEFGLDTLDVIQGEVASWVSYIDYELSLLKEEGSSNGSQFKLVKNLFERALIPNCLNSKLWLKYISFMTEHGSDESGKKELDRLYSEAINKFIPLDENFIRFNYVYYLLKTSGKKASSDYIIELIQLFIKEHQKDDYLDSIKIALDVGAFDEDEVETGNKLDLEKVIATFFLEPQEKKKESKGFTSTQNSFIKLLRNDSIPLVVNNYLKVLLREREGKSTTEKIRSFFNKYHEKMLLDPQFWYFYIKFEGLTMHSISNLKKIMHIVKTKSKFLKVFIDSLIEIEYDIISANYLLCDRADDTLILKDIEVSTSLSMNKAWRSRLASVNFQIQDLGSSKPKFNQDDELLKLLRKRVGHAGVTVETTPEITNTLFDNHGWKDLNEIPHLPTFKNVERANTPITYPSN